MEKYGREKSEWYVFCTDNKIEQVVERVDEAKWANIEHCFASDKDELYKAGLEGAYCYLVDKNGIVHLAGLANSFNLEDEINKLIAEDESISVSVSA